MKLEAETKVFVVKSMEPEREAILTAVSSVKKKKNVNKTTLVKTLLVETTRVETELNHFSRNHLK